MKELEHEKEGGIVWQKLNNLFEEEGFDKYVTLKFSLKESSLYQLGINHLMKNGAISIDGVKKCSQDLCIYRVRPRNYFQRFYDDLPSYAKTDEVEKKSGAKIEIHIDRRGITRTLNGKKLRYAISKNRLEYVLNLAGGYPIDRGIPDTDITNRSHAVKEINRLAREKLLLEEDLIVRSPYDLNEDFFTFIFGDLSPKRYLSDN